MRTAARYTSALLIATAAVTLGAPAVAELKGIDCTKATAPDELTVCSDCDLSRLDERMSTYFTLMAGLVGMGTRGAMYDEQAEWEKERAACKDDKACLRKAYEMRIAQLQEIYDQIKSNGPF